MRISLLTAAAATILLADLSAATAAPVVTVADPGGTTSEIGARIRWGGTGFEASIFDSTPFGQGPTLNPGGAPVWQINTGYDYRITFDSATGELGLSVDFNNNGSFGSGESIVRSVFNGVTTSYAGLGFGYMSISGNEGSSTARSTISSLAINGDAQAGIAPGGGFAERFYRPSDSSLLTSLEITGELTFTTLGTSQERPSWNFTLRNAATPAPVPEPATLALFGMGLLGLGLARRRRA